MPARLWRTAAWVALCFACAPVAGAAGAGAGRPDLEAMVHEVEAAAARARAAPAAERGVLEGRVIEARQALIDNAGDDPRGATWLTDQAEAVLWSVERDGTAASVMAGIPTRAQRERAREAGQRAKRLSERASQAAERTVARLEATVFDQAGGAEGVRERAAEAEKRLATLVDVEQAWRIPLVGARGAVLEWAAGFDAIEPGAKGAPGPGVAEGIVETLERLGPPGPDASRARRLALGQALLMMRRTPDTARAAKEFGAVLAEGDLVDPLTRSVARVGGAACAAGSGQPRQAAADLRPAVGEALPVRVLLAEGAARVMLAQPAAGVERAESEREAISGLIALLDGAAGLTPAERDWLESTACRKLGEAVGSGALTNLDALPGWVTLGRAAVLASDPGEAGGAGGRVARRAEAARLLKGLSERGDAGALRARALWELAVVLSASGEPGDAAEAAAALQRLATEFPGDGRVRDAVENGARLARFAAGELSGPAGARARGIYANALEVAVGVTPPLESDALWRCELARLRVEDVVTGKAPGARTDPGWLIATLDLLEKGTAQLDAKDPLAASADLVGARAVEATLGSGPVAKQWQAATERAASWAERRAPSVLGMCLLARGEALVDAQDREGMRVLTAAQARGGLEATYAVRLRLAIGRAQRQAGDSDGAFATLRALAEELEAQGASGGGGARRSEAFWCAWTEMLEILAEGNGDGSRTPTIRLQLNRLALIDKDLGPEPWRSRIARVRDSLR